MKPNKHRVSRFAVIALFALPALACGPDYERIDITKQKASPLGGDVRHDRVSVPEGMIVKAHVVPYNDDGEMMGARVVSGDTDTLEVVEIVNDRDYAFIGKKAGRTQVQFIADDETVLIVDAVVTEQPPPDP